MPILHRFSVGVVALAALALSIGGAAAEATKVRFTLDWKLQGIHAWYFWAKDKGYFAAEGLDVVIDQGEGAAATVTRIMSGAYDAGFGDINAAIAAAADRPNDAPVTVDMIYSKAPFALLVKAQSPIHSVKDLAGKKIGGPAGSAALKLIPALAKQNGLDPGKVEFTNMAPNLQEQMLIRGQVDVSAIFTATSYMNIVALKLDPDKDFRWISYADAGLDLYSMGVMVSPKLAPREARSGEGARARHQPRAQGERREPGCRDRRAHQGRAADQHRHREAPAHLCLRHADGDARSQADRHRRHRRRAAFPRHRRHRGLL